MATIKKLKSVQQPLVAEVVWTFADSVINAADGVTLIPLNTASGSTAVIDLFDAPPGFALVGGDFVVDTVFNCGSTFTISLGDAASATKYLAATDAKTAARTALTLTNVAPTSGGPVKATLALAAGTAATTGKVRIRALYTLTDRVQNVL